MFVFIDKLIEKRLKAYLHNQKQYHFKQALERYKKENPNEDPSVIQKKLEAELIRAYAIVDESILAERIIRGRYTFWVTLISSLIVVGAFVAATHGIAALFAAPVVASFVAWAVSLATIPVSYNGRVKGAVNCVIAAHKDCLEKAKINAKSANCEEPALNSEVKIAEITSSTKFQEMLDAQIEKKLSIRRDILAKGTIDNQNKTLGRYTADIVSQNHANIDRQALQTL